MGSLGGSQYIHSLCVYLFSPTLLKGRPQKLLPAHLSCKTFLSLCSPRALVAQRVVIINNAVAAAAVLRIWKWRQWWGCGKYTGESGLKRIGLENSLCQTVHPSVQPLICGCHWCLHNLSLLRLFLVTWKKTAYILMLATKLPCFLLLLFIHLFIHSNIYSGLTTSQVLCQVLAI